MRLACRMSNPRRSSFPPIDAGCGALTPAGETHALLTMRRAAGQGIREDADWKVGAPDDARCGALTPAGETHALLTMRRVAGQGIREDADWKVGAPDDARCGALTPAGDTHALHTRLVDD